MIFISTSETTAFVDIVKLKCDALCGTIKNDTCFGALGWFCEVLADLKKPVLCTLSVVDFWAVEAKSTNVSAVCNTDTNFVKWCIFHILT